MPNKDEQDRRIAEAVKAMRSLLKKQKMSKNKLKAADGIIRRAAFMQVELEDLESDINKNGPTEMFSQTPGIEYARERPSSAIYTRQIKNYTSACKQLFDLLPQEEKSTVGGMSEDEKALLNMMKTGRRNE